MFEDHGPLELDGVPGAEPMGPLKQESTVPFSDHGTLELAVAPEVKNGPRAPVNVSCMWKCLGPKMFHQ